MEASSTIGAAYEEAMRRGRQSAIDLGDPGVGVGHLALGIVRATEGNAYAVLARIVPTLHELEAVLLDVSPTTAVDIAVDATQPATIGSPTLPMTTTAELAIRSAVIEVERLGDSMLDTGHLLLGILRDRHSPVADAFARFGVTYESIEREISPEAARARN